MAQNCSQNLTNNILKTDSLIFKEGIDLDYVSQPIVQNRSKPNKILFYLFTYVMDSRHLYDYI